MLFVIRLATHVVQYELLVAVALMVLYTDGFSIRSS